MNYVLAMPLPHNAHLWNSRRLAHTLEFHRCNDCSRPTHGHILSSYGVVVNVTNRWRSILRYPLVLGRPNVLQCIWCLVPRNRLYRFPLSSHCQSYEGLLTPRTWAGAVSRIVWAKGCVPTYRTPISGAPNFPIVFSRPNSGRVSQLAK